MVAANLAASGLAAKAKKTNIVLSGVNVMGVGTYLNNIPYGW